MHRSRNPWLLLLGFLILLVPGVALATNANRVELFVGDRPPDFLGTNDDHPVRVSDLAGKLVIVDFWASWCGPCREELPILDNAQRLLKGQLVVIAVNHRENLEKYRQIVRALQGAVLTLVADPDGVVSDSYGVKGLPHTVLIDRSGHIAAIHTGYGTGSLHTLVEELNDLLKANDAAAPPMRTPGPASLP